MDGFSYYCNANLLKRFLHNIVGNRIFAKLPYNLILNCLIKDFYYSLLNNPTHSGPLTDEEDMESRSRYHLRENFKPDRAIGFKLMYGRLEDYRFLEGFIKSENLYVIHLIRNNALKIYLSKLASA